MKLIIDGAEYELDGDWLVEQWYHHTLPYLDPEAAEGKKYTDLRLGAKAMLRLRLGAILKLFAGIFQVDDWRTLQPKRGEDILLKLHQYMTILLRAEAQTLTLEMESDLNGDRALGSGADHRLTLTRASFAGGQTLYQRPIAGALPASADTTGTDTATHAVASISGLVSDAHPSEI